MRESIGHMSTARLFEVYNSLQGAKKFLYQKYDMASSRSIRKKIAKDIESIQHDSTCVVAEIVSRNGNPRVVNTTPLIDLSRKYKDVRGED